jgi:hypothetical protein
MTYTQMHLAIFQTILLGLTTVAGAQCQTICSNATLKGYYGVQITGTRPAPSILSGIQATPGTTEQVVGVVIQIFAGDGNFTQTDNVKGSLSGITPDRPGTGTYSVNPDCTGTFTVNNPGNPPIVNRFVIVDNGQEFLSAVVSPQPVFVTATGRKMSYLENCPATTTPVLTATTNTTGTVNISASGIIVVWGQGFTPSGGNSLVFQRPGYQDVVLSESGGGSFWDYSNIQINASLGGLLASGKWNLTVHSACSGSPSNSLSVAIQ